MAPAKVEGRDVIVLSLPEPAWVDVEAAHATLQRARSAEAAADRLASAQEAATLVAPGLLPGLEAPWLTDERNALDHLRIEALQLGAEAARTIEPPLAETLARAAIAAAPFRESAWVALIAALQARGNVAEALQAYDEVRRLLREELGAVPGPELLALHGRLLAQADEATPPSLPVAPATAPRQRSPKPAVDLVEREDELRAVDAALDRVAAAEGGVVMFEGPAGIGKTRLLEELRRRAEDHGSLVLAARAGLLEREFGFGVVRQLLEEVADPDLTEGPAAAARVVLGDGDGATIEGTFPILNGLFRLVERLAAERPLALCVDDLQWSDPASLRFAAYLARRVADLPVLIAATVRTGEPDADEALLGELAQEPITMALTPRPLTVEAATALLRQRLGDEPDGAFAAACHEVTAGNPLLLRQLITALAAEGIAPDGVAGGRGAGDRTPGGGAHGAVASAAACRSRRWRSPVRWRCSATSPACPPWPPWPAPTSRSPPSPCRPWLEPRSCAPTSRWASFTP